MTSHLIEDDGRQQLIIQNSDEDIGDYEDENQYLNSTSGLIRNNKK